MRHSGRLFLISLLVAAGAVSAQDTEKKEDKDKKHALKGGFRGQSTEAGTGQTWADVVAAAKATSAAPKPASPRMIDNRTVGTLPKPAAKQSATKPAAASPSRPAAATPAASAVKAATEPAAPAKPPAETAAAGEESAAPTEADERKEKSTEPEKEPVTEEYWRAKAARVRTELTDSQARLATAKERAARLESDFYGWDDGQYRDRVIKPAWDEARAKLQEAEVAFATAQKAAASLEEDARKAGALPGWIRP